MSRSILQRRFFLFLAVSVGAWRLWCHDAPLSVLLVISPFLGLALAVATWRARLALAAAAVVGAGIWALWAWMVCSYSNILLFAALFQQMWCAAGVAMMGCAVVLQIDKLHSWRLRIPALVGFCLLGAVLVLPLTRLYRTQVAPSHVNGIFSTGEYFNLEGADGEQLRCRWSSPASPRGVVVFTHGLGGSFDEFVGIHLLFIHEGWAVFDWNLRGHGHSAPAATTYGLREGEDLIAVWAEARRRAGRLPMAAYGASLGAAATLLVGSHLDGCGGLILESSFAELAPLIGPNLPGPLAASARFLATWGLGIDVESVRPIDALPSLSHLPVLLGTAEEDLIVPPDHGWRLAAAAPWATHVALAGRGHMDLAYDQRWTSAVATLLKRVVVGHGSAAAPR